MKKIIAVAATALVATTGGLLFRRHRARKAQDAQNQANGNVVESGGGMTAIGVE